MGANQNNKLKKTTAKEKLKNKKIKILHIPQDFTCTRIKKILLMSSGPSTASAEARLASEAGTGSQTVVTKEETDGASAPPTLRLKLKKPDEKDRKKVKWTSETVDNEHLGKKRSKCCCVFVKKRAFGESDSDESDGDCDHCSGHTPSDSKVSQ